MAVICDKCGDLIPTKADVNQIRLEPDAEIFSLNMGINFVAYDLCSNCYREIFDDLQKKMNVEVQS